MTMAIMVIILLVAVAQIKRKQTDGADFGDVKEVAFEVANIKETAIAGQKP
jgi:hypothetical protein